MDISTLRNFLEIPLSSVPSVTKSINIMDRELLGIALAMF
jgi:hypothetical protein